MPVYSFVPEFGRCLTSMNNQAGDEVTLSHGNPIRGGEFCTFRLREPLGQDKWGDNYFDLDAPEQLIQVASRWDASGEVWATRAEIDQFLETAKQHWGREVLEFKGMKLVRSAFGHWREAQES